MNTDTDFEWERWGKNDPYFGVLTHSKFRLENLTQESKKEFFQTGEGDVKRILSTCRSRFGKNYTPQRVLDFGCGVGRLVVPFAQIADDVVGLDVSESMLNEAKKNCEELSLGNVSFFKADDELSNLQGKFNLINSCIVFQHIPVERGKLIFRKLLTHLEVNGIAAIQMTYSKTIFEKNYGLPPQSAPTIPPQEECSPKVLLRDFLKRVRNKNTDRLIDKEVPQQTGDPEMQMNSYNLNEIFFMIQSSGIKDMYTEFTDHGGELGVAIYFQKK